MPIERPSDRIYCCFFCLEGTTRDKDASCPRCSKPINIAPLLEQRAVEKYTLKNAVGRGYYGITFHAENQIGRSYAVKLVPARIYEKHDKSFSEEIRKYNKLGSHPHIADLVDAGEVYLTVLGVETLFYFIVMEWIEGETLTKYIRECSAPCNEVYGAILDITSGLERFESQNLWHNDLNSDNILFKRLTAEERRTRRVDTPFVCKIVDVGSAVFRQAPIEGRIRDLAFLGHHINDLRKQSLKSDHQQTREDIFFLNSLEKVVARLLDEDQTRGFATAAEVSQEVSDLYQQRYLLTEPTAIDLDDPFAYLNANDFPNDTYINYLFSDRFPWVRDIVTPEAQGTLITGPRGSGKTMILRSMRLKTRLHPFEQSESVESIRQRVKNDYQLAFYVSARIEIGNQCSLSKLPRWATSEELTVYYFLLLYTVEILETLFYGSAKSILRYDSSAEVDFCKLICTSLCLSEHPTIQNVLREVKSRQYEIERDSLESTPPGVLLNSNYLSEVSRSIRQLCVEFSRKTITYLLDDFSLPKVPASVQRTLLPLIWNSGGGYSFRVSAHSESVVSEDLRQNRYQVNREYREINLGANYLNSIDVNRNETAIESSVGDIFARRFAASRRLTDLTLPDILGSDYDGRIAGEIRTRTENKTLRGLRYYGRNTLIKLCSGDISYLIDMLGQMLRNSEELPISIETQHKVIKQYAWRVLYRLNDHPAKTCNLYQVALNFGRLSLFKLRGKMVATGQSSQRPAEYLRIEVSLGRDTDVEIAQPIIAELLQSGIFIDGGFSNSSQQNPARRLLFRKIFTPAFPTTYNSRDTFSMTAKNFADFAKAPERFLRAQMGEDGVRPEDQQSMMDALIDRAV